MSFTPQITEDVQKVTEQIDIFQIETRNHIDYYHVIDHHAFYHSIEQHADEFTFLESQVHRHRQVELIDNLNILADNNQLDLIDGIERI